MAEKKKIPEIRFKGFADEWEEQMFIDILDKWEGIRRGPFGSSIKKDMFIPESDFVVYEQQNAIYDRYVTRYNITKDKYDELIRFNINTGDFIMSGAGTIGKISRVPNGIKQGIFNQALIRIKLNYGVTDSEYFLHWMRSDDMQHKLTEANPASAMVNLVPMSEVKKWEIFTPDIKEQSKIGTFFKHLDTLITLHQRKYDKLVNVKKSMLEKMFPKIGATIPEIRFKGFGDAWEEKKLESIFSKIRNAFVGTSSPYYVEDGHFYLESNNVKDGQINRNSEIFINDEFYEKQKDNWLHTGDIVMVQSGHVGHTAVIPPELNNMAAHALIIFAEPKEKINSHFFNYQFQTAQSKNKLSKITTGNTIRHILSSEMKEYDVMRPEFEEQTKIGIFFKLLDNLITLHQRELEKLKNIKKAMLEKMFV